MIGCILQIHEISDNYFKYKTITEVKYENEVMISLPAITLCLKKELFIRNELLPHILGNKSNNYSQDRKSNV